MERRKKINRHSEFCDDPLEIYMRGIREKLLTQEEQIELLKRIKSGDKEAQDEFITRNLRLVLPVARKYVNYGLSFADLIQEGNLGLIKALEKYDLSKGYKFSTYATWWIRQRIVRSIHDKGKAIRLPVHISQEIMNIKKQERLLTKELDREPTKLELANALGTTVKRLEELEKMNKEFISLNKIYAGDRGNHSREEDPLEAFIKSDVESPEDKVIREDIQIKVHELLGQVLKEKEIFVIVNRFGLGGTKRLTLEQIGQMFNVSRERIRQIEEKALQKLQKSPKTKRLVDYSYDNSKTNKVKKLK